MELMLMLGTVAATLTLSAFIVTYAVGLPWWRSPYGRSIMAMKVAVLLIAVGGLLRRSDLHDMADALLTLGWPAVALVMVWRLIMLRRDVRRSRERNPRD